MRTRQETAQWFPLSSLPAGSIHFIGIGGAGMSGIARVLLHQGREVSGSDIVDSESLDDLRERGAEIFVGHAAENVGTADVVVVSDAVTLKTNPEFIEAARRKLHLVKRSQALGSIVSDKRVIAVTGSHGKSSTTAMLGQILIESGLDPLVVVGADVSAFPDRNVRFGDGEFAVVEACEAYSGVSDLAAEIVLLPNLEPEHLDFHLSWEGLRDDVAAFATRAGTLVYCATDAGATEVAALATGEKRAYEMLDELKSGTMKVIGEHNRLNASGAVTMAVEIGVDRTLAIGAARNAVGCARRLEYIGKVDDVTVFDDYAHHPTEIRASVQALKKEYADSKLIVVYQPHLYTRTLKHLNEFSEAFTGADHVVMTDIYPAREEQITGVSAALIVERLEASGKSCDYIPSRHLLPRFVDSIAESGDVVVGMGAGNIEFFVRDFVAELERRKALRVCVMLGGESAEREVSLTSGRMAIAALRARTYNVVEFDPAEALLAAGDVGSLIGPGRPDIVFLALHGTGAEDGRIQGLLDLLHIPYTGSGIEASSLAMNKHASKKLFASAGLPVPDGIVLKEGDELPHFPTPCVVKPNAQGSTIGLTIVRDPAQLGFAVRKALKYDREAVIEEFVEGVEISVPVLCEQALPVVEICPKTGSYDYVSKYTEGATDEIIPARIAQEAAKRAQEYAIAAHRLVGAADFSRTDMIVARDRIVVLEINTIPGLTNTSLLPNSAVAAGISYEDLCERILLSAMERYGVKKAR
ncbi:MAG: D-alanine--D-alanine ligase [Armatimonadota bacterium]|nr:D-alanine--D-alanine ligase [Armatimonadota bacterium]